MRDDEALHHFFPDTTYGGGISVIAVYCPRPFL